MPGGQRWCWAGQRVHLLRRGSEGTPEEAGGVGWLVEETGQVHAARNGQMLVLSGQTAAHEQVIDHRMTA